MKKIGKTVRRRRKEGKTDYKLRFGLLKSEKPRIVFRKSNKYIIGQTISSDIAQDKILVGVTSKDLLRNGWPEEKKGSLKSLPACYLTGFMLGRKSKVKEAIFDIGLNRNVKKSRIYAFLKGVIDAGIKVSYKEEVMPEMKSIEREDMRKIIEKIKEEAGET